MIGRLQVNDVEIELTEGVPFPLNFSIADIKEPNKRKRNYSKSLNIHGTKKNLDFFSSTYLLSLSTVDGTSNIGFDFDPTLRIPAKYWSDNGKLLFNGLFQLEQVIISNGAYVFQCKLFSNFIDLFMKLGDLKVSELGWSEYNHALTRTNIANSWATSVKLNGSDTSNFSGGLPLGFGYHYGMVDYGYSTTSTLKINELAPLVYKREVFKKCLEISGFTWNSDFLDSSFYKKHLLGFGGGEKVGYSAKEISSRQCNYTTVLTEGYTAKKGGSYSAGVQFIGIGGVNLSAPWDGAVNTDITDGYNQNLDRVIKVAKQGKYSIQYSFPILVDFLWVDIPGYANAGNIRCTFDVLRNNNIIKQDLDVFTSVTDLHVSYASTLNLDLNSGDEIWFRFSVYFDVRMGASSLYFYIKNDTTPFSVDMQCSQASLITNDTVELSRFIPDLKASQFLEAELMMYNLYLSDADIDGVVKIEPLINYYQDTTEFIDITDIVDLSKDIIIKPASTIEGKRYKFLWAEDKDYDNESYRETFNYGYGDHTYTVPSTFQTGDRIYQLPYAQSIPIDNIYPFVRPRIVKLNGNIIQPFKGKPRNYIWNGLKAGKWRLTDTNGVLSTDYTTYPCVHHFDNYQNPTFDLNWGLPLQLGYKNKVVTTDNLYNRYHEKFIKEITGKDSKLVELYVKLSNKQIAELDFSKFIMWNGVLFRLNEVRDFDSNMTSSTQIELARILEADSIDREAINAQTTDGFTEISIISSSNGVDVKLSSSGINETLINSDIIRG